MTYYPNPAWHGRRPKRKPSCIDLTRKLLSVKVAALKLNPVRDWYVCRTGKHKAHCACERVAS